MTQVSTFIANYVPEADRVAFRRLMQEWDGSPMYRLAFYSADVLAMKLKEAQEEAITW